MKPNRANQSPLDSVLSFIASSVTALAEAEDCGDASDHAGRLLTTAEDCLHRLTNSIHSVDGTLTDRAAARWLQVARTAVACMEGAVAIDAASQRSAKARRALTDTLAAIAVLKTDTLPRETAEEYGARLFLRGVALAADLLEEADKADADIACIRACYRGRGVKQNEFFSIFLEDIVDDVSGFARDGFVAALSSHLAASDGEGPSQLRALTWEEIHGGPSIAYPKQGEQLFDLADKGRAVLSEVERRVRMWPKQAPDLVAAVQAATTALLESQDRTELADTMECLQLARARVYEARQDSLVPAGLSADARQRVEADLLCVHRMLNGVLGGQAEEDRSREPTPLRRMLDRIEAYMAAMDLVSDREEEEAAKVSIFDLVHTGEDAIDPPWYEVTYAEARGDEAAALAALPALRNAFRRTFEACDMEDGRWPLLQVSLDLLEEFVAGTSRKALALQAGNLIMEVAEHYNDGQGALQDVNAGDRSALAQASYVVIDSLDSEEPLSDLVDMLASARERSVAAMVPPPTTPDPAKAARRRALDERKAPRGTGRKIPKPAKVPG